MIDVIATAQATLPLDAQEPMAPDYAADKTVRFQPERLIVGVGWNPNMRGWGLTTVTISGPRLKRDGTPAARTHGYRAWHNLGNARDPYNGMDDWLVSLVQAALAEIIAQTTPSPSQVDQRAAVINT